MKKKQVLALFLSATMFFTAGSAVYAADFEYDNSDLGTISEKNLSDSVSELEQTNSDTSKYLATQGMVLLENNDHVLPIAASGSIALFGGGAYATIKGGTGSGSVNQRDNVNVYEGFVNAGYDVVTSEWIEAYGKAYEAANSGSDDFEGDGEFVAEPELTEEEIRYAAQKTDTAIYVISRISGEASDRTITKGDYYLSEAEEKNLAKVAAAFDQCIVVLNIGGIIDTKFINEIEGIDSVLLMSQAGQRGGDALVEVLNGTESPSGKLTDTWAINYEDYPSSEGFASNDGNIENEYYTEGIYVGYRYFDTFNVTPAYEFGYGLSYTDFDLSVDGVELIEGEDADGDPTYQLSVSTTVTNTGDTYSGKEVVQVYFSAPSGSLEKPYQELAGYGKTDKLAPGESQTLTIKFNVSDLSSYSEESEAYIMEPGDYIIRVGNSSRNTKVAAVLTLDRQIITEQLQNVYTEYIDYAENASDVVTLHRTDETETFGYEGEVQEISAAERIAIDGTVLDHIDGSHSSEEYSQDVTAYVSATTQQEYLNESLGYDLFNNYTNTEYTENIEQFTDENGNLIDFGEYTLADVYDGTITMEQFVSSMSVSQMADFVIGGSKLPNASGQSSGAASENSALADGSMIGAQGNSVSGSAGETAAIYINSKLIPNIVLADGPAGLRISQSVESDDGNTYYQFCTAWPIGTLLAQTWDDEAFSLFGEGVGLEMARYGVTLWLAPGMNIHRNPLCGRNFEYYSEDPYLSGMVAAWTTQSVQSAPGVGVTLKHYMGNSQETARTTENNYIDERTIREIYVKAFEIAVKAAQPMALMTSYNLNNGVPAGDDYALCTQLARTEWNFQGLIVTDWQGGQSTPALSMHAGNDLIMPGKYIEDITVRGFENEDPHWAEDDCYPVVSGSYNAARTRVMGTQVEWGDFVLDPDDAESTPGYVEFVKEVDTEVYENATRNQMITLEDGTNVLEDSMPLKDLVEANEDILVETNEETGKTTLTYRGHYKANISLGDLQKSVASILKVVMASANFADVYNSYQEYIGNHDRIQAAAWTTETYADLLRPYNVVEKGEIQ